MKTQIKMVASKLATVGLALAALAAPLAPGSSPQRAELDERARSSTNGLSSMNGLTRQRL